MGYKSDCRRISAQTAVSVSCLQAARDAYTPVSSLNRSNTTRCRWQYHSQPSSVVEGTATLHAMHSAKLDRHLREQNSIKATSFRSIQRHGNGQLSLLCTPVLQNLNITEDRNSSALHTNDTCKGQVNVKFTLGQATKARGEYRYVQLYPFFNLGTRWGEQSAPHSGRFTPGKDPVPIA